RRRRDFLAGLVEALTFGFCAKDPSSGFSYRIWNRKMEEILGHSAHSAVYSRDWKLFGAEAADKIEVHDREVLDSPEKGRIPRIYRLKCPAGQRTVSVVRVPLYDDLLETTLVAGVVDDITRENQLEEQLRQAQKMEAVGRLAGGVAHDFNNLLQVIMGAAEMGSLAPDDSREYFDQVLLAGEKAMSLTRQLLSFSRTEGFSRKPFEVDARVGDFTAMVHRIVEASISLEFIPGAGGAVVNGDPFQLEQVLMNLIVNARDALEGVEGGRITVSTSVSEAVCSAGTESVSCAEISVSDNGPGVPEDVQNMIFEPFFTTKAQGRGTGLGLASSYAIVVKHGGTIVLESSPGEGSTFRVFLPIWEGQAGEDENGIPHRKVLPAESGLTILLAEDEEMVREIVKAMLEKAGHVVLEAPDGRRALEVFRANHE
ncbi:MAG TPA: ATP-binding protein, partial [Candidatus Sabulitectum sp.]|nr:ATP-binding protein [Candidatus Sabulitectum sp.]